MEVQTETQNETQEAPQSKRERDRARNEHAFEGAGAAIVLGPKDRLEGKLTVESDVRIQGGTVQGELTAGDIRIESDSNVDARLEGRNINVRGRVNGDVNASGKLVIAGSGSVNGNVRIARLVIEDGATLNGNVQMEAGRHKGGDGGSGE